LAKTLNKLKLELENVAIANALQLEAARPKPLTPVFSHND